MSTKIHTEESQTRIGHAIYTKCLCLGWSLELPMWHLYLLLTSDVWITVMLFGGAVSIWAGPQWDTSLISYNRINLFLIIGSNVQRNKSLKNLHTNQISLQPSSQRNLLDYFKDSQSPKAPKKSSVVPSNSSLNFTDTSDKSPALPSSEESFNEILISSGSEDEISTPVSKRTIKQDSRSSSNSKGKRGRGSNSNSKNAKKQKLFENDNKWSCLACTFLNHSAIAACEICDTPRKNRVVNDINETGSNDDFVFEMNDSFLNSSASKRVKIVSPGRARNLSPSRQRKPFPNQAKAWFAKQDKKPFTKQDEKHFTNLGTKHFTKQGKKRSVARTRCRSWFKTTLWESRTGRETFE